MDNEWTHKGKVYILKNNEDKDNPNSCKPCAFFDKQSDCPSQGTHVLCYDDSNQIWVEKGNSASLTSDMILPTDAQERKQLSITTGVLDYFPLAIAAVAKCSWAGNQQHHADKPLHWDKTKSTDHADCIARHLIDRGKFDTDGQRHSAKLAWRALALLELELENEK